MPKYRVLKDVESSKGGKFIKNEIVEGTPSIKLKDFVSVIRKNTWGDNNNDLVIGFDIEQVDEKLNELSGALDKEPNATGLLDEPTFFQKNKLYIIGAVVLIGGFFVYKKFYTKGK